MSVETMPAEALFREAHEKTLPHRLDHGLSNHASRAAKGLAPLALRIPSGPTYTYRPDDDTIELSPGDASAGTVVELDESDWVGLFRATETVFGLLLGGRARVVQGDGACFVQWETALRVLYESRPIYDPSLPMITAEGHELDPTTRFELDDDRERMAEFLRIAGYLVVREVFSPSEVDRFRAAADDLFEIARPDDRQSWWSKHEDGSDVLCRVLNGESDARLEGLPSDPRLLSIVALADEDLEPTENDSISILYKRSGIVFDGKADQPWHRDCGLGGHALMCPVMNGSVFLEHATRESGELRFLPGSWKTAGCLIDTGDFDLGVALEAGPGDFSIHYGDGLHAGTPPTSTTGPFRRSLVFEYGPRGRTAEQSQDHYDQLMHEADASILRNRANDSA